MPFRKTGRPGTSSTVWAAAIALLLWAFVVLTAPARATETRLALVIGNSAYASSPLANPKNDAEAIARALTAVGFTVTKLVDADQKAMRKAVVEFGRKLRASDAAGLFYYAGHGVQVDGQNFLVPVGADIAAEQEVAVEGLNLSEVLKTMERTSGRVNIVILDACRNNPFPSLERSGGGGLAPVDAPAGTLIAFATAPGQVATDGVGSNSPYSGALAQTIGSPGVALEEVFRRVRRQVLAATHNRQTPWEHSSMTVEFFFQPKIAEPEGSSRPSSSSGFADRQLEELAAWEKVKVSDDPAELQRHIDRFPRGLFAELAQHRIDQLKARDKGGPSVAGWFGGTFGVARGDPEAERLLEEGLRLEAKATPEAYTQAFQRYKAAAERGWPAAMHQVARAFDKGRGAERSIIEAAAWYQRAAALDYAPSMASLGTLYEFADGVPIDIAEAVRLYKLASDAGEPNATTSLAYLYQLGKGVARDAGEARRLYTIAAEKGNDRAMYNLALMHIRGEGGPRNFDMAVILLNSAIEKGHVGARRELAFLYDEGRGVKRDPEAAARHLLAAFRAGHKDARNDLLLRPDGWSARTRREIQKQLAVSGHYAGRVTGLIDPATRKALEVFGRGA